MGRVRYLISGMVVALAFLIPSMIGDVYADATISSCGILSMPGETYVLNQDLTSSETCFKITADRITLDGNGYTITGSDSLFGVDVRETTGVTVKNINISGFNTGIYVAASDTHVINNTLTNMSWSGITVSNSCVATITGKTVHSTVAGIVAKYSTGITINGNNADSNSQNGIRVTYVDGIVITGNSALTPGSRGIVLQESNDGFLIENTSSGNEGITLFRSNNNTLINNTIESCSDCNSTYVIGVIGIMIWESNGNTLIKNDVSSTHLWGIYLTGSDNNTLLGNVISNHKKEIAQNAVGLQVINSHGNTFNYNTISYNESPYYIQDSTENKIYNNNFISNLNEGRIIVSITQEDLQYPIGVEDDSGSNIFYLDSTIGGNYWDSYDDSSEGCEDLNNDNFCDEPFVSHGTVDNFAWTVPDGWLVNSPTIPDVDSLIIPEVVHCPNSDPTLEPETPTCIEPQVLDTETNTCVTPEPETPTCIEPQVLDTETNTCVTPEPEIIPVDDIPIENHLTLICHMPPGNEANPQNILIPIEAYPAHLAHDDYEGVCNGGELEIQEFAVVTGNEILDDAIEILRTVRENLHSDTNIEYSISQAAQLHELFTHEDKTIKKAFQSVFNQFNKDVKAFYGDTQVVSEKFILHELDKTVLKLQIQISKAEKEEQIKNKIQSTIQFVIAKEKLQKINNQIGIEKLKFEEDNENLETLKLFEFDLLKQTLIFTAKSDGEKITPDLLKSINKWAKEKVEENHNDGNGNSGDSNAGGNSDDSNAGGNSGKGGSNSGKGSSNSGKGGGNSGKGRGN